MEAVVDSVGRVVVPKPLRDALGLVPGSTVDVSRYGEGLPLVPGGRTARLVEEDGRDGRDGDRRRDGLRPHRRRTQVTQPPLAVDTSVAVPLLAQTHGDHAAVVADLVAGRFDSTSTLGEETTATLPRVLSGPGIAGGAVHGAVAALAAEEHGAVLHVPAQHHLAGRAVVGAGDAHQPRASSRSAMAAPTWASSSYAVAVST